MALYENGKRISGIRDFPAYTWAEYHALPVAQRPKVWKCTDRDYTEIPIPASNVTYGSGSVEDALDGLIPITASTDGGVAFTVSRIYIQKYSDSVMRIIFYDDNTSHTYKNAICNFSSTTFTPR